MKTAAILAALAIPASVWAQSDTDKKRKEIMEQVEQKLKEARQSVLDRVAGIIDEELGRTAKKPAATAERQAALEKKLRDLNAEAEKVRAQLLEARKMAADEKLYHEARKAEMEPADANDLFQEAMEHHNSKEFNDSIAGFKKIVYAFHDNEASIGRLLCTAAYNIACGYSLDGKKEEALDWLEISIQRGFLTAEGKLDHMENDSDLDNIRNEARYKEFVRRAKSK